LPELGTDAAHETNPGGDSSLPLGNLMAAAALLAAVAAAGYWGLSRPPAAAIQTRFERPGTVDRGLPAPPAAATGGEVSAARQAWDAALAEAAARPPGTAAAAPEPAAPAPSASPASPASLEDVVGRVMPAVVLVETSSGRGSGFYVRPDTVITNVHVVKEDGFVRLRRVDGTTVSARVDLRSPAFDIAILRVATPSPDQVVIPMGSAETLRPGQEVITIGSALGTLQNSVTRGIVSGVRRSGDATLVQTDAAANPGNSGGPLLDRNGVAIGITTMGYRDQQGLNFAVAIDHARAILDGRLTGSSSTPLAMNQVKALSPALPSEAERARDDGQRAFLATAARLSRTADALDSEWKGFRQSCYTSSIPGAFSREWFVMLSPRPITPSQVATGSCAAFVTTFQQEATRVAAEMRSALEGARRAGLLPGMVRDTLQSNRLEFDGWDR
jgi:S1-C subfamily serine protease